MHASSTNYMMDYSYKLKIYNNNNNIIIITIIIIIIIIIIKLKKSSVVIIMGEVGRKEADWPLVLEHEAKL